ncbi:ribosome-binding factor A [Hornefia porci]|uniref:Ribosome-binding factor A n=1 Tax=Hornefia porci TaxID=2652292 RepID=A0A1Q9JEU0_9FIRM|nr:30S ribosome-binding factor RbfA [Hornefia porci]OLR54708.1 ribosome-binding factor A [Hornefia porci]
MGKGYRQGRIGEEIRKIISRMLLRELKDPRLSGMISITGVDVTRDNSYATCYVTILDTSGDEEKEHERQAQAIEGLESARGLIRREIGKEIKLRHVPELIFKIDRSMEYGRHIDEVIRKLEHNDE